MTLQPMSIHRAGLRRLFATLAIIAIAILLVEPNASLAQAYPSQPVRMVVGDAPGGVTDLAARIIAPKFGEALGQQFIVENRPGGTGAIAATTVSKAAPDGYTLFLGNNGSLVMNPILQPNLLYDPLKSFAGIALISSIPFTVAVHPSVAVRDLRELIDLVKSQPGKFSYASAGNGTIPQLIGEWIKFVAGIQLTHIPYKGGAASTQDVVAGHVPIGVIAVSIAAPHARAGRLNVLAVSSPRRLAFEPTWPTIEETGFPGLNASVWFALVAPASVPNEVASQLSAAANRVLKLPDVNERFNAIGASVMGGTAEELNAMMRTELQSYERMVRQFNIRLD
jgi:tripartite-type tricarboxylate transporter receptor subunit TctC